MIHLLEHSTAPQVPSIIPARSIQQAETLRRTERLLVIGRRGSYPVFDFADASGLYSKLRDESGEGASTWPNGKLRLDGVDYVISYNGRIWQGETAVYPS